LHRNSTEEVFESPPQRTAKKTMRNDRPTYHNWTYIISERRIYQPHLKMSDLFYLQLADVEAKIGTLKGVAVRAEAFITEFFYNNTQQGFCDSKIIEKTKELTFVGNAPFVFKPGMPYQGAVTVRYQDLMAVPEELLQQSELTLQFQAKMQNGSAVDLPTIFIPKRETDPYHDLRETASEQEVHRGNYFNADGANFATESQLELSYYEIFAKEKSFEEFRSKGTYQFTVDIPEQCTELNLKAFYRNSEESKEVFAEETAYASYEKYGRYISVHSRNRNISIGHYITFHIRSNIELAYFDWTLISKNIILNSGRIFVTESGRTGTTFSLVVSSEMAPGFQMMVHTITEIDFQLLTDSVYYPVHALNRHHMELKLRHRKDHSMETVEATSRGDPGSVYLASTLRSYLFPAQGKNHITKAGLIDSLYSLEKGRRQIHKVFFYDRDGLKPDAVDHYPSLDYGIDASHSLQLLNMIVLTDYVEVPKMYEAEECNDTAGVHRCTVKGCYTEEELCDGYLDCEDGTDESGCHDRGAELQESMQSFKLSRWNRITEFYDIGDGDWGWFEVNIDEDREQFLQLKVPLITDSWFVHVMSISEKYGINILDEPVAYDSIRPIHFYCEAPTEVRRGECVGVRCVLLNRSKYDWEAVIIVRDSADYEFIHVEDYGYVVSYDPRTSRGEHHHMTFVRAEDEIEVLLPIKPTIEQGEITVSVTMSTQIILSTQELSIVILPEGCPMHRHTSALLDLKSRAFEMEYLDIVVDETPLIPYELIRRYIFGSPYGWVTISGDAIGPTFLNNEPVNFEKMFPEFTAKYCKGSEYHVFNLAANAWQLHYFRLTNQLFDNWDLVKTVLEQMNIEYTAVMRYFSSQGWVSAWSRSGPSVWLTSWCLRIFQVASFQDWEDFFFVDPLITSSAVMWLINFQNTDGAFSETEDIPFPMHRGMDGTRSESMKNISLTAHVLITLHETAESLQGKVKRYSALARHRAMTYLERSLTKITDPYDLAITAYALALSKSSESDLAFGKLLLMKREEAGMAYWSPTKIYYNNVRYEFNRPFLQPKDNQVNDALAVEATAYALLTLFIVRGSDMGILQDQIVNWLNTMRIGYGGFLSTVDTIVAMEALVWYSYYSRIKDITNLYVEIDIPDSQIRTTIPVTGDKISQFNQITIPNVWGLVNIFAKGSGQALVQMDVVFGVDNEGFLDTPPEECFTLSVSETFRGRNKSEIDVRSCFSWTCTHESEASGMAQLVIDMPSGYIMLQVSSFAVCIKCITSDRI
jgi:hypothetical protein